VFPAEFFYRGAIRRPVARFGSSGIRGLGNVDVTPELALHVGIAIGELYGDTLIGRDPRLTGPMLVQALAAGVLSTGSDAIDGGLVDPGARRSQCRMRGHGHGVAQSGTVQWNQALESRWDGV
jgi:phosphomannomutase